MDDYPNTLVALVTAVAIPLATVKRFFERVTGTSKGVEWTHVQPEREAGDVIEDFSKDECSDCGFDPDAEGAENDWVRISYRRESATLCPNCGCVIEETVVYFYDDELSTEGDTDG